MSKKNGKEWSILNIMSYNFGNVLSEFMWMAFSSYAFFFYEAELGLNVWYITLAFTIYTIWDAINDPLSGFISDKPRKWNKKWGRRFPWIVTTTFLFALWNILVYTPPNVDPAANPWVLFLYLVIILCIFDTLYTLWSVNFYSMFPDKFRTEKSRRRAASFGIIFGVVGILLGALVPPMFVSEYGGDLAEYRTMSIASAIMGVVFAALMIPGTRESPKMISDYMEKYSHKHDDVSFVKGIVLCLKERNFMVYIVYRALFKVVTVCLSASLNYYVKYVLEAPPGTFTSIMLIYLFASIGGIPLWNGLAKKVKQDKTLMLAGTVISILSTFALVFSTDLTYTMVVFGLIGIGLAGAWIYQELVYSNIIDDIICCTDSRPEGRFKGVHEFLSRSSNLFQTFIFAVVHSLTKFEEGADTQLPEAIFGIRLHISVIPAIFGIIGVFIFAKFYSLSPERIKEINESLHPEE